jgi:hypothetical protein
MVQALVTTYNDAYLGPKIHKIRQSNFMIDESNTHWIFAGIAIILVIGFISDRLIANYSAKKFSWKETPGK